MHLQATHRIRDVHTQAFGMVRLFIFDTNPRFQYTGDSALL